MPEFFSDFARMLFMDGTFYHFWYFPALIICVLLTALFFLIGKRSGLKVLFIISLMLYLVACLGSSYYAVGKLIPVVSEIICFEEFTFIRRVFMTGLPFFILGLPLVSITEGEREISKTKTAACTSVCFVAFIAEIAAVRYLELQRDFAVTLALLPLMLALMLFLISRPFPGHEKAAHTMRFISNLTFYSHPLFIVAAVNISRFWLHEYISQTMLFLVTVAATALVSLIVLKLNLKPLNFLVE